MKKILFFLLCITFSLQAKIIEVAHFSDLLEHVDLDTLVLLDIDDTLIEPMQHLGSNRWFEHRIVHYTSKGYGAQEALELALREWKAVQGITKNKLVEEGTDKIVASLQARNIMVMGFTTRGLGISTTTNHQLKDHNIDLKRTSPTQDEIFFVTDRGVLFRAGILFTAGGHKGKSFDQFLKCINLHPRKVVFINDKLSHIKPVEQLCKERGIEFIGLRYSASDARVEAFDPVIAEIQWEHFWKILSNEDAYDKIYR